MGFPRFEYFALLIYDPYKYKCTTGSVLYRISHRNCIATSYESIVETSPHIFNVDKYDFTGIAELTKKLHSQNRRAIVSWVPSRNKIHGNNIVNSDG